MPLRDLGEPAKYTDAGAALFAVDEETLARVMIAVNADVLAYYQDDDDPTPLERPDFRTYMVAMASLRYDEVETKDGYVVVDTELMELPA